MKKYLFLYAVLTTALLAYPLEWLHDSKFWVNVARVDNAYGDRNLIPTLCACEI